MNEQRKARGFMTLQQDGYGDYCRDSNLIDVLTDLLHAVGPGAFNRAIATAMDHYDEEGGKDE